MIIGFLTGLTKLVSLPPDITRRLMESSDTKLMLYLYLFEVKDISVTTRTLGSDEMVVESHYSWTPLDYYVTGHAISHSNCPWKSFFCGSSIDDEKFDLFCQGCAAPEETACRGHISYADFSINDITSESIRSFVNIPQHILQDMRWLYLSLNKLDGSACDLLAQAVPSMFMLELLWLELLWLQHNPIGSGGAVVIKALCSSGVKQLALCNTGIGEQDCEALCELLKSSHTLQYLDIPQNNLSSKSVTSIITGLSHNNSLTYLNISNSHFSMANVYKLASILRDCTLTQLVLDKCHISGHGASELATALCNNSTLEYLNLNHNSIGVQGASSMSNMLQHNTSLEYLYLCDDSLGEEGVHQLITSLKHHQTMGIMQLPEKYKSETSEHRIRWGW